MSGQIFISYRREESGWSAGRLYDRLCAHFDRKQVFMDIDAIALGEDFVKAIETRVAKCDVLIAVIGTNWLTTKDDHGDRRLDNPEDFVRMEIGTALKRDIRVVPVLVDGASMPKSTDLPEDLKPLVRRNALRITGTSFEGDCQRLAAAITQVLERVAAEEQERLDAECREREEKERIEAEQREKERRDAERLDRKQKQRQEVESSAAQQRENELVSDRREKDRLAAERQRHLQALAVEREEKRADSGHKGADGEAMEQTVPTGHGSEAQLEAEATRSAVPPDQKLRLLQKWSFAPFALVLIVSFLPLGRNGGLLSILLAIVVLCLHFFFARTVISQAVVSWIGFLWSAMGMVALQGKSLSIFLIFAFMFLGAFMKTILARRRKLG